MVARFLEEPLWRVRAFVRGIEALPGFRGAEGLIQGGMVRDARVADDAKEAPGVLGEVAKSVSRHGFLYHDAAYAREYLFDDTELARFVRASGEPALAGMASRLRLVNTRNRLTYALVHAVLEVQAEYLESANPLALRPLSQSEVSAMLCRDGSFPLAVDEGRVSRLVRNLSIRLPGGEDISLQTLFPSARQHHCQFVTHVIKEERRGIIKGSLAKPLTDDEIAQAVERDFGVHLSRRTVAYIRQDLGIPDHRARRTLGDYHAVTSRFSAMLPLSPEAVRAWAPRSPGVYEIRTGGFVPETVYVGSARNLRKRLADHLRGSGDNVLLRRVVAEGAGFRYRRVADEWRIVEREVYRAFCETYGTPPLCNRVSP